MTCTTRRTLLANYERLVTCGNVDLNVVLGASSAEKDKAQRRVGGQRRADHRLSAAYPQLTALPELASRVAALGKPLAAQEFVDDLKRRHRAALDRLNTAMLKGTTGGVKITVRKGQPWITVPQLEKLPEPRNVEAPKAEVVRRWGTIDLLDILKNTDFLTEFTSEFVSVATRENLPRDVLRRRLLLCLFALGTNMGTARAGS